MGNDGCDLLLVRLMLLFKWTQLIQKLLIYQPWDQQEPVFRDEIIKSFLINFLGLRLQKRKKFYYTGFQFLKFYDVKILT